MSAARTLLVIGRGFIGSRLATVAAEAGLRVTVAGREPGEGAPACDLLDLAGIEACIDGVRPDLVVNAAGAASVGRSWEHPAETFAVNADGALNLLEALARRAPAAHLLCISSADVYGIRGAEAMPLEEALEPRPVTPYGASKAAMEILCGQYAKGRDLRVGIVRAFNLIGPGQAPEFALPGFARRVVAAERAGESAVELALGNPDAIRDFTDVRDGARALLALSQGELCGTYNLCSGKGTTIAGLVEELSRATRVPLTVRQDPSFERPADPPALVGDPRRLREATGFATEIPLARTLADLLDYWRARPASA